VGFTLLVSAAGGVTLWLVLEGPFPAKAEMVAYCVGILIAGQVLYKARRSCLDETLHGPVTWPLISAGLAAVVLLVAGTGTAASVLRLALGVAVLAFFLDRLSRFVSAFCDDDNTGANLVLCALGVTAAAPVWLGVWADYPAEPYWFNNAVFWVSVVLCIQSVRVATLCIPGRCGVEFRLSWPGCRCLAGGAVRRTRDET
jgi:hypothetical protein